MDKRRRKRVKHSADLKGYKSRNDVKSYKPSEGNPFIPTLCIESDDDDFVDLKPMYSIQKQKFIEKKTKSQEYLSSHPSDDDDIVGQNNSQRDSIGNEKRKESDESRAFALDDTQRQQSISCHHELFPSNKELDRDVSYLEYKESSSTDMAEAVVDPYSGASSAAIEDDPIDPSPSSHAKSQTRNRQKEVKGPTLSLCATQTNNESAPHIHSTSTTHITDSAVIKSGTYKLASRTKLSQISRPAPLRLGLSKKSKLKPLLHLK